MRFRVQRGCVSQFVDLNELCSQVPGCGSVGDTKEEVERNIQEAIEFHLEGLREEGCPIPEPSSYSSYVDIAA